MSPTTINGVEISNTHSPPMVVVSFRQRAPGGAIHLLPDEAELIATAMLAAVRAVRAEQERAMSIYMARDRGRRLEA